MLNVKTPDQVLEIINTNFAPVLHQENVPLTQALGRIVAEDIEASEFVPDFDRSSVDGYAVRAADTFGCSASLPALFTLQGEVLMGEAAPALLPGHCLYLPTGGAVPQGADAVVMIEYSEDYGDGTIGLSRAAAPGGNIVFRGDDVCPGKKIISRGTRLQPQHLGALAALGWQEVPVLMPLKVGVISTGDELVEVDQQPGPGQVRDINSVVIGSMMRSLGATVTSYGIIRDEVARLRQTLQQAVAENDLVLLSGGSSVGAKDAACRVIEELGEILLHGIAIKPGKPTILGQIDGKPVAGLPGHPAAAFFICQLFMVPLAYRLQGRALHSYTISARLAEALSANDGRTQYISVSLQQREDGLYAVPLRAKSSQISNLSATDGYICIPRDAEGLPAGATVNVALYGAE